MKKHKTLSKTTVFPASQGLIWRELQKIGTLQYIAAPFASFCPLNEEDEFIWREGNTFLFRFKLFCLLPLGVHTIHIASFAEDTHTIRSREHNDHVPVWNHHIYLKECSANRTEYTDEVELYAGWKTIFVFLWAKAFYSHRQKKWIKLLEGKAKAGIGG